MLRIALLGHAVPCLGGSRDRILKFDAGTPETSGSFRSCISSCGFHEKKELSFKGQLAEENLIVRGGGKRKALQWADPAWILRFSAPLWVRLPR